MKAALLVVDLQRIFLDHQKDALRVPDTCSAINEASRLFRANQQPVVHIRDIQRRTADNHEIFGFVSDIDVAPEDVLVEKWAHNAFWDSALHGMLQQAGVGLVVISGFAAENCVLATYFGALENGYKTAILQKGVTSRNPAAVQELYRDRHLVSLPVLEALFT
jgi:nicotinamidase-related amidase